MIIDSASHWFGYLAGVFQGTHGLHCPTVQQVTDEPYGLVATHMNHESMPSLEGMTGWGELRMGWWR